MQSDKLNDFLLGVNCQQFPVNFELLCCFSDKFMFLNNDSDKFACSIPEQYFCCFLHFIAMFQGEQLIVEENSCFSWNFLINFFGLLFVNPFIPTDLPCPQSLNEAINFLSQSFCFDFEKQFHQSISILIQNLNPVYEK
jgi:hypothetical protein